MTATRSIDPRDYQALPRPIGAMAKSFPDGHVIAPHAHERDQLLYAVSGVMRVRTGGEAWIVPADRAVYLPAGTRHSVAMGGAVEMRTLYIEPGASSGLPDAPVALEVSGLLRELVLALLDEPLLYDETERGGAIASLILSEIAQAPRLAFVIPMPRDGRLDRLCSALIARPERTLTLEEWAHEAGASGRTLARLFRREVGMTFGDWRQRVRFHRAAEGLARGEPIARVAAASGYRSASAFAAAFAKVMGARPSAFRDRPAGRALRQLSGNGP